jgi:hypothetical protein
MERVDGLKDKELFPVALARGRLEKPKKTIARMVRRAIDLSRKILIILLSCYIN